MKFLKVLGILYVLVFGTYSVQKYLKQRDVSIGSDIDYKQAILQIKLFEMGHMDSGHQGPTGSGI